MATLEIRGLSAGYGRARVLFDIDLDVHPGEVVVCSAPVCALLATCVPFTYSRSVDPS